MGQIYVVVGTTENISRETAGGPLSIHYFTHCVRAFASREDAEQFVLDSRLSKPRKDGELAGISHYRGGYYGLEVEPVAVAHPGGE